MKIPEVSDWMKKYSITCMVIIALCFSCFAMPAVGASITASIGTGPSTATVVRNLETEGFEAIAAENWTGLLSIAEEGLVLDAGDPVFYAMKGYAFRKLGNSTAALPADSRAIEIQPNPVRYANRGVTYLALANYSAALSDGQASAALDPDYGEAYALEAMAYLGMNNTTAAQEAIGRALAIEPEDTHYWHVQGLVAMKAGNCTLAVSSLQRSIAIDPGYSLPWPTMQNATVDLETAQAQCKAGLAGDGGGPGKAPLEIVVVVLAVTGTLFLVRRKNR
jgi:tetratricopeptide (TPR) repeat protein